MRTPAIDYNAARRALVSAVMQACGLDQNHVIMAEPEVVNSPRPTLPYLTLKFTNAAKSYGWDQTDYVAGSTYTLSGVRAATLGCNSYGRSHEEAYALLQTLEAVLSGDESTLNDLRASGIAVWSTGDVRDLSMLLTTGYEGRAQMDVTLGLVSCLTTDLGVIDSVNVVGVATDGSHNYAITTHAGA